MKKVILISALCIFSYSGNAQVTIVKDSRIDELVNAQGQGAMQEINGYRLQLAFDSNRSFIDDARSRFSAQFPKVDTYVEFVAPHYFLKVGDFRTQLEAEKVKAATASQFPTGFIVKEKINLPRIDQ
ncbi:SPOR domain-containing protein [Fluviicola chungangensis]|uniref:SPOR domain-containing protein n=1 Tax=Fluviicola chungangensis TaxID=2597671 RepID=A0A556N3E6_9FLAO|nr:SPOR domain-containing protein [Fluviicola chungangensis]TSJ46736.1 SPOR domain-containing protein [Fluviicola chungangensis]